MATVVDDEYVAFLTALTKSDNPTHRSQALAELLKVGPKGYEHGWRFVGVPLVGALVNHPTHGHGRVVRSGKATAAVEFTNGHKAAFEHGGVGPEGKHFVPRAAGRVKRPLKPVELDSLIQAQVHHDHINLPGDKPAAPEQPKVPKPRARRSDLEQWEDTHLKPLDTKADPKIAEATRRFQAGEIDSHELARVATEHVATPHRAAKTPEVSAPAGYTAEQRAAEMRAEAVRDPLSPMGVLGTPAKRREYAAQHAKMDRSEFDALDQAKKDEILANLRHIVETNDRSTRRTGMGITVRNTESDQVASARSTLSRLTRPPAPPPEDRSPAAVVARMRAATDEAGIGRALRGDSIKGPSKAELEAIAREGGWHSALSSGLTSDKMKQRIMNEAAAHHRTPAAVLGRMNDRDWQKLETDYAKLTPAMRNRLLNQLDEGARTTESDAIRARATALRDKLTAPVKDKRRAESFAAKWIAEGSTDEPTDENLAAVFAHTVKPPPRSSYDQIRAEIKRQTAELPKPEPSRAPAVNEFTMPAHHSSRPVQRGDRIKAGFHTGQVSRLERRHGIDGAVITNDSEPGKLPHWVPLTQLHVKPTEEDAKVQAAQAAKLAEDMQAAQARKVEQEAETARRAAVAAAAASAGEVVPTRARGKRGDLAIRESESSSFHQGRGYETRKEYELVRVNNVSRDGEVTGYHNLRYGDPQPGDQPVKVSARDKYRQTFHVIPANSINAEAAIATTRANRWHTDRPVASDNSGKPYDSLEEIKAAIAPHVTAPVAPAVSGPVKAKPAGKDWAKVPALLPRPKKSLAPKAPAEVNYTEPTGLEPGAPVSWTHYHEDGTHTARTGRVWDAGPQGTTWVIPDERKPTDNYSAIAISQENRRSSKVPTYHSHDSTNHTTGSLTAAAAEQAHQHRNGPPPVRFTPNDIHEQIRSLGVPLETSAGHTSVKDPTLDRILTGFSPYTSAENRLHPTEAATNLRETAALYRRNITDMQNSGLGRDSRIDNWRKMADVYDNLATWFDTEWNKRVETARAKGSANKGAMTGTELTLILRAAGYVWKVQQGDLLVKVGPKGYEHGWRFVGVPGVGTAVHHPEHGPGIVTRSNKKTAAVRFDSGHEASFEHGAEKPSPRSRKNFVPRDGKPGKKKYGRTAPADETETSRVVAQAEIHTRLAAASVDQLTDAFHNISQQPASPGRDRALRELDAELARRENLPHLTVTDDPHSRKIDELVARGYSYTDAYAEAHGMDPTKLQRQERIALIDAQRRGGERRDQTLRRMYSEHVAREYLDAEAVTRGNVLTAVGKRKGIEPMSLWSGNPAVARKYASDELKQWWEAHGGRQTWTQFRTQYLGTGRQAAEESRLAGAGRDYGL